MESKINKSKLAKIIKDMQQRHINHPKKEMSAIQTLGGS